MGVVFVKDIKKTATRRVPLVHTYGTLFVRQTLTFTAYSASSSSLLIHIGYCILVGVYVCVWRGGGANGGLGKLKRSFKIVK